MVNVDLAEASIIASTLIRDYLLKTSVRSNLVAVLPAGVERPQRSLIVPEAVHSHMGSTPHMPRESRMKDYGVSTLPAYVER
jgi:hypothetical protein